MHICIYTFKLKHFYTNFKISRQLIMLLKIKLLTYLKIPQIKATHRSSGVLLSLSSAQGSRFCRNSSSMIVSLFQKLAICNNVSSLDVLMLTSKWYVLRSMLNVLMSFDTTAQYKALALLQSRAWTSSAKIYNDTDNYINTIYDYSYFNM